MPLLSLNLAKVGMVDRMLEALTSKLLDGQRRAIAFSNFNKDQLMYDPMANFGRVSSPVKVKFDVYEGGMNLDLSGNLFTVKSFARIGDFLDEIVGIKALHLNDQYKDQDLRFEKSRHKAASTKELLTEGATQDMVLSRHLFDFKYPFGRGGFGKVFRASNEKLKHDPIREFAIKEMEKARVIAKKGVEGVLNELKLHSSLSSNFIVKVHYAFQDELKLYLVMDLVLGGDLQFHLRKQKFTEEQTKFVIACLVQALDAVHTAGIIHKDIKPANLVFDAKGYLKLVDFGIARLRTQPPAKQEFGTHGYMAPEVMSKRPYGTVSDYFAVGVIAYECMLGKKPYSGSKQEIQANMMQSEIRL